MKKYGKTILLALIVLAVVLSSAFFFACSKNDGMQSWNVSADGGNVTASLTDNGKYGFILKVEGSGKIRDYSSVKDAPWYGISGRIKGVDIADGVTYVGSNAFTNCELSSVILPDSVTSIGSKCFPADARLFAYGQVSSADNVKIYLYSEGKPATKDTHWRMVDGVPVIWETTAGQTTKVLFIGNSFTYYNDIPALFGQIATAAGESVTVDSVTRGSWTLTKFADPTDEEGGKIVEQKLTESSDYDAVVLQEQSTRPLTNYSGFLSAAKKLQTRINETQTDCQIYLYATWGYKEAADVMKVTIPEMEQQLRTGYETAAQAIGAQVCYVGKAFTAVYNAHQAVNDEYYANPEKYANDPEKAYYLYYAQDNKHPSYTGSFLSACVHVATILKIDPRTSTFTGSLDETVAAYLKEVAYFTVSGS